MDRDEDFDFVSDVFNHQFIVDVPEPRTSTSIAPPGGISGKKDATTNQPTPPANKNTSTKQITPTNDDNDIPTNDDNYVYSTPPLKKKSKRNVPDSTGCDGSEVNAASSPLDRGPVNQSQDQDSQACDDSSISFGM